MKKNFLTSLVLLFFFTACGAGVDGISTSSTIVIKSVTLNSTVLVPSSTSANISKSVVKSAVHKASSQVAGNGLTGTFYNMKGETCGTCTVSDGVCKVDAPLTCVTSATSGSAIAKLVLVVKNSSGSIRIEKYTELSIDTDNLVEKSFGTADTTSTLAAQAFWKKIGCKPGEDCFSKIETANIDVLCYVKAQEKLWGESSLDGTGLKDDSALIKELIFSAMTSGLSAADYGYEDWLSVLLSDTAPPISVVEAMANAAKDVTGKDADYFMNGYSIKSDSAQGTAFSDVFIGSLLAAESAGQVETFSADGFKVFLGVLDHASGAGTLIDMVPGALTGLMIGMTGKYESFFDPSGFINPDEIFAFHGLVDRAKDEEFDTMEDFFDWGLSMGSTIASNEEGLDLFISDDGSIDSDVMEYYAGYFGHVIDSDLFNENNLNSELFENLNTDWVDLGVHKNDFEECIGGGSNYLTCVSYLGGLEDGEPEEEEEEEIGDNNDPEPEPQPEEDDDDPFFDSAFRWAFGTGSGGPFSALIDNDDDGDLDIITAEASWDDDGGYSILPNFGNGIFTSAPNTPNSLFNSLGTGSDTGMGLGVPDWDEDGELDYLYLEDSLGACDLKLALDFDFDNLESKSLDNIYCDYRKAVGDLDGDGDEDLFMFGAIDDDSEDLMGSAFRILLNDGAGDGFAGDTTPARVDLTLAAEDGESITEIGQALGDIDGDNDLDLMFITSENSVQWRVYVLLNNGDATFANPVRMDIDDANLTNIKNTTLVDLDEDGDLDLAVISGPLAGNSPDDLNNVLYIFYWNAGNYILDDTYDVIDETFEVEREDFNQDGDQDLVTISITGVIQVFPGDGLGKLGTPVNYDANNMATFPSNAEIIAADVNGDNYPDIAWRESNNIWVFYNIRGNQQTLSTMCFEQSSCNDNDGAPLCLQGVCSPLLADGTACAVNSECASDFCLNSLCFQPLDDGAVCTDDAECLSGLCFNNACSQPLDDGSACTDDVQCSSGLCTNNICSQPAGPAG